jgi:hypothetical protein
LLSGENGLILEKLCPECGSMYGHIMRNGPHFGLYCALEHWQKWVKKKQALHIMDDKE